MRNTVSFSVLFLKLIRARHCIDAGVKLVDRSLEPEK
jgi:hypothetical protein